MSRLPRHGLPPSLFPENRPKLNYDRGWEQAFGAKEATPTIVNGYYLCGICSARHMLEADADFCCPHAKGIGVEDMDATDMSEARMKAEIERLMARVAELEQRDEWHRTSDAYRRADWYEGRCREVEAVLAEVMANERKLLEAASGVLEAAMDGFGELSGTLGVRLHDLADVLGALKPVAGKSPEGRRKVAAVSDPVECVECGSPLLGEEKNEHGVYCYGCGDRVRTGRPPEHAFARALGREQELEREVEALKITANALHRAMERDQLVEVDNHGKFLEQCARAEKAEAARAKLEGMHERYLAANVEMAAKLSKAEAALANVCSEGHNIALHSDDCRAQGTFRVVDCDCEARALVDAIAAARSVLP